MNELTLFFGPRLPHELEHLGLAFISAPTMQPDFAVGSLSAQRYVSQNYAHKEKHVLIDGSSADQDVDVVLSYAGTNVNGLYANSLSFSSSGKITLSEDDYGVEVLNSPIKVRGITITRAGSWAASLVPGTVVRPHIISDREPQDSWVRRCMSAVGTGEIAVGDRVFLIYTIPEAAYGSRYNSSSTTFPGTTSELRKTRQVGRAVNPSVIGYEGALKIITSITVNGLAKFPASGTASSITITPGPDTQEYDGTLEDPYIKRLDIRNRLIEIYDSIGPNDHIVIEGLELAETYEYLGYRDYTGTWHAFDANPEYGHFTRDDRDGLYYPSSSLLLEEITIYLVPTALFTVHVPDLDEDAPSSYAGMATIKFHSAYNYGETHFVRHKVGGVANENIVSRSSEGSTNTWGHAKLGLNHYDEGVYFPDDVFDPNRPSSMPLGRIVLSAPVASKSVAVADIRQRGGGVPEEFPMSAVNAEEDGLDRLRMHWDMGIWEGKAIKEGGVIEIRIDPSILDTFTAAEVERRVQSEIPPGVDYEIKYVAIS